MTIGPPVQQNIQMRLIGSLMNFLGDPDWEILKEYAVGVRLGVGVQMPRTPEVFPEKTHWNVAGQATADPDESFVGVTKDNYPSARAFAAEVERDLRSQAARGQVEVLPEAVARERYGPRLAIASLAAIEKERLPDGTSAIRIVHDGTHRVGVNGRIRVRGQISAPTAPDIEAVLRILAASGTPFFMATADVAEAHRQVQIDRRDVGYQACQLEKGGPVFANLVGTWGVASAGYWWGRLGAGLLRLLTLVFGGDLALWPMLYVDDWLLFSGGARWREGVVCSLFFLVVLGVPMSWKKISAGFVVNWIGVEVNVREWTLGLSQRRADWAIGWMSKVLEAGEVNVGDLKQATGRLQFALGALPFDRPFLACFHAVLAVWDCDATIATPCPLRAAMLWLVRSLGRRRATSCKQRIVVTRALFRVDAKAEGSDISLGGWEPAYGPDGSISLNASRWFATRLTPAAAPWAFDRNGKPLKVISALELLATVVSLIVFSPPARDGAAERSAVEVTAHTDSQVASAVIGESFTSSFPLCLIAMEAAAQMESRGLHLKLSWIPRDANREADALTNFKFAGFSEEKGIQFDIADLPFLVLSEFQAAFMDEPRQPAAIARPGRVKKRRKLRETEPW